MYDYPHIPLFPSGPLYCRAASGECCFVILRRGAAICPISCPDDEDEEDELINFL